jgi:hypothetical protein
MPTTRDQARDYIERATQDGHPCTYGHLGCAAHDGGPCSNELALRFNLLDEDDVCDECGEPYPATATNSIGPWHAAHCSRLDEPAAAAPHPPEPPAQRYTVTRTGRTWSVVDPAGQVVEGGFFARAAAQECRDKWEQAAGDPLEQLATELAALDDAYAEMDRQAAAAAQLEPGEPEPEDPEQLLRRAALDHRGQP